jgi:hypothetical protein
MEEKISDFIDSIAKILFGILGSLVIGYIFFQYKIFSIHYSYFIFTTVGIYGSIFFSLFPIFDYKKQILILISVIFLDVIIIGKPYHFLFMIRDTVMILIIFFSIKTYIRFITKNKNIPLFLRAFGLSVIYAVISIPGITILFFLDMVTEHLSISFLPRALLVNAEMSGLVGIGLGLGFDSWEFIKKIILKEKIIRPV